MKINSTTIRKLIFIHLFFVSIFLLLWSQMGVSWNVIYIFDLFVLLEILFVLKKLNYVFKTSESSYIIMYLMMFITFLFLTQIIGFVPIKLSILAYRRTFRFFLFYLACACLMSIRDVNKIFSMFVKLQIFNFILTLYQYFVLGLMQDNLGGIFGTEKGANGYTNIFLCILCIYAITKYLSKKTHAITVVMIVGSSLVIAVLAELKLFFFELVLILVLAILLSRPSKRTIKILLFGAIGVVVALAAFAKLFPEQMSILISEQLFEEYATGVTLGYNISRINAYEDINRLFFKDNLFKQLFGYGFGNCEVGSVFYEQYSGYHYTWFTHQVTLLETGVIGFLIYMLFYVLVFVHATKAKKRSIDNQYYFTIVQIMSVICLICMYYNQSLRTESAYLAFFVLSISIITRREEKETEVLGYE